jgi:hypothetical protein
MNPRWWNRPFAPYLLLATTPALTLPLSAIILSSIPDCGVDEPWWELGDFQLVLLPALADFVPFLWVASALPDVKKAGIIAGLIGSARYGAVQAATFAVSTVSDGLAGNPDCTVSTFSVVGVIVPLTLTLWLASAALAFFGAGRIQGGAPS